MAMTAFRSLSLLLLASLVLAVACKPPETENRFRKAVAESLCPDDPQPVMAMLTATEQEDDTWLVTKDSGASAGASFLVTEAEGNDRNIQAQNEEANAILNSPDPTCT